ncbi:MAG: 2'-5' RNA ligase family protein [Actinomycetota bacterium]|nr:2'-5' RNA ligase family protein [Actinomycetota bacterium]
MRFALANAIPKAVREQLTEDLRQLVLPEVWLATLGSALTSEPALVLAAVPDAELLAAHNCVHDALAGRVRGAAACYLPGQWVPHCPLSRELTRTQLGRAMSALGVVKPLRAKVTAVGITDTRTGTFTPLRGP